MDAAVVFDKPLLTVAVKMPVIALFYAVRIQYINDFAANIIAVHGRIVHKHGRCGDAVFNAELFTGFYRHIESYALSCYYFFIVAACNRRIKIPASRAGYDRILNKVGVIVKKRYIRKAFFGYIFVEL